MLNGRNSLLGSFFGNDPTFRDPFQQANAIFSSFFDDPFFRPQQPRSSGSQEAHGRQGPSQGRTIHIEGDASPHSPSPVSGLQFPTPEGLSANASRGGSFGAREGHEGHRPMGPVIDELDEEASHLHLGDFGSSQPDAVEEPEEEEAEKEEEEAAGAGARGGGQQQRQHAGHGFGGRQQGPWEGGGGARGGVTYHRVTVRSGGRGGMHFTHTQTTRMGPGGVTETQEQVRDSRTGHESLSHTRRLGDKGRTTRHVRRPGGRFHTEDVLHNLEEGDAEGFDEAWAQHAQRGLAGAGWGGGEDYAGGAPRLGGPLVEEYESEEEDEREKEKGGPCLGMDSAARARQGAQGSPRWGLGTPAAAADGRGGSSGPGSPPGEQVPMLWRQEHSMGTAGAQQGAGAVAEGLGRLRMDGGGEHHREVGRPAKRRRGGGTTLGEAMELEGGAGSGPAGMGGAGVPVGAAGTADKAFPSGAAGAE